MADATDLERNHWGDSARYQRSYHFSMAQQKVFNSVGIAMLSPAGGDTGFSQACIDLYKLSIQSSLMRNQ